ncbi:MAG: hypothetical protein J0M20_02100, partial [Burkholderiales bacterium]|nr:hypothetical protein [Burkholderiales bacterium]
MGVVERHEDGQPGHVRTGQVGVVPGAHLARPEDIGLVAPALEHVGQERLQPAADVAGQNVDSFHHLAGSRNLIEIHGSLHRLRCTECPHTRSVPDFAGL